MKTDDTTTIFKLPVFVIFFQGVKKYHKNKQIIYSPAETCFSLQVQ